MNLTPEQKQAVQEWVSQNASISDVQKKLSETFGLSMTYMDVRFLIDDIGAELQDAPEPKAETPQQPQPEANYAENTPEDFGDMPQEQMLGNVPEQVEEPSQATGGVKVSVSPIQRPGAYASGSVVFSDGESAEWLIDYQGRLSLVPQTQGYQPSQIDVVDFQQQLQSALS